MFVMNSHWQKQHNRSLFSCATIPAAQEDSCVAGKFFSGKSQFKRLAARSEFVK